jgi:hypothetical protein
LKGSRSEGSQPVGATFFILVEPIKRREAISRIEKWFEVKDGEGSKPEEYI